MNFTEKNPDPPVSLNKLRHNREHPPFNTSNRSTTRPMSNSGPSLTAPSPRKTIVSFSGQLKPTLTWEEIVSPYARSAGAGSTEDTRSMDHFLSDALPKKHGEWAGAEKRVYFHYNDETGELSIGAIVPGGDKSSPVTHHHYALIRFTGGPTPSVKLLESRVEVECRHLNKHAYTLPRCAHLLYEALDERSLPPLWPEGGAEMDAAIFLGRQKIEVPHLCVMDGLTELSPACANLHHLINGRAASLHIDRARAKTLHRMTAGRFHVTPSITLVLPSGEGRRFDLSDKSAINAHLSLIMQTLENHAPLKPIGHDFEKIHATMICLGQDEATPPRQTNAARPQHSVDATAATESAQPASVAADNSIAPPPVPEKPAESASSSQDASADDDDQFAEKLLAVASASIPARQPVPAPEEQSSRGAALSEITADLRSLEERSSSLNTERSALMARLFAHLEADGHGLRRLLRLREAELDSLRSKEQSDGEHIRLLEGQLIRREEEVRQWRELASKRQTLTGDEAQEENRLLHQRILEMTSLLKDAAARDKSRGNLLRTKQGEIDTIRKDEAEKRTREITSKNEEITALRSLVDQLKRDLTNGTVKADFDEFAAAFDAEVESLKANIRQLEIELDKRNERIGALTRDLMFKPFAPVGRTDNASYLRLSAQGEHELYQGEHQDIILLALERALSSSMDHGRVRDVIQAYIAGSEKPGALEQLSSGIKEALSSANGFDRREKQALETLGFSITGDGAHWKLCFRNDDRYTHSMPRTGSDWRGFMNCASDIAKMLTK